MDTKLIKKIEKLENAYCKSCVELEKQCKIFLAKLIVENGGEIDFSGYFAETDDYLSIAYNGGNHPEYSSTMASAVHSVYLKGDCVCVDCDDCDCFGIDDLLTTDIVALTHLAKRAVSYNQEKLKAKAKEDNNAKNRCRYKYHIWFNGKFVAMYNSVKCAERKFNEYWEKQREYDILEIYDSQTGVWYDNFPLEECNANRKNEIK